MIRKNQTQIVDLNWDCQLLIVKELDLISLISLAETNNHFYILVAEILRLKFSKKLIVFSFPYINDKITLHIHEEGDYIKIQNWRDALKVLKLYGHLIRNLKIHHNMLPTNKAKSIYTFVNMYCSETLKQLNLINSCENFFHEFSRPFQRVENVSLHGKFDKLSNSKFNFSEMFPAMQRLSLEMIKVEDIGWIDQQFAHLIHLNVFIWGRNQTHECFLESMTVTLIRRNPQIRSLLLRNPTPKLLSFIANELHSLDSLELHSFDETNYRSDKITFNSVRVFKVQHGFQSAPKSIAFNKIESFITDGFPRKCSKWIEFVKKNQCLKTLRVIQRHLDNEDVSQLAVANLNLTELSAGFDQNVKNETIVQLIENSKYLEKIELIKYVGENLNQKTETPFENIKFILQDVVGYDSYEWHITNENSAGIVLKRVKVRN